VVSAEPLGLIGRIRTLSSDLFARAGIASRAGLTFGAKRDLFAALGYARTLQPRDYRERYTRNGIARSVVEALPKATWRGSGEVIENEDPDVETPFEEAWKALNKRLKIWSVLQRADVLAGLGRYSVVLLGAPGDFASPLPTRMKPEDLFYLQPFSEEDVSDFTLVDDEHDPRFGLPRIYKVRRISGKTPLNTQKTVTKDVHFSRILHIADGLLDDRTFGTPRLQPIWNDLDNLEKVVGGGSEAFWIRANQGMHIDFDPDTDVSADEAKKVKDNVEEYQHGMRRAFATMGAKVNMLGSDVANFSAPIDAIITLIAGATGIPKRILVGSERGELSSTQDKDAWDTRVQDRRTDFVAPYIVQPLVDLLIERGVLPEPSEYQVWWPEIDELDEQQKGTVAGAWSNLNKNAGGTVVTAAEIREHVLGLEPLTEEQLAQIEEEKAAAFEEQQAAMGGSAPVDGEDPFASAEPKALAGKAPPLRGQLLSSDARMQLLRSTSRRSGA